MADSRPEPTLCKRLTGLILFIPQMTGAVFLCVPVQVASGIKAGLSLQQQMDSFLEAAAACREGGVNGRLRKVLKTQLQQ